ncbi:MAG: exosome complex protein Rrp42 [Candidatus Aenigmarchaeota archaeon]|nr:exosome complex protein Rrp42 [Candidatus Aenigmarchaeota archaeon]
MKLQSDFLKELADKNERFDKRKPDEFREISIEKGVIGNAEGSARVKIGNTEVIVGVKMEIGTPFPDKLDEGTLMVSAELSPIASSKFELGPPRPESIELARVVDRGIRESGAMDVKKLCIKEGEKVWIVSIDIEIINHDGNLIDVASIASVAALVDAKLPKVVDDKVEYGEKTNKSLPLTHKPVTVTVSKMGENLFVDANSAEEELINSSVVITTKDNGNVSALQKKGTEPIFLEDLEKMIDISSKKAKDIRKLL